MTEFSPKKATSCYWYKLIRNGFNKQEPSLQNWLRWLVIRSIAAPSAPLSTRFARQLRPCGARGEGGQPPFRTTWVVVRMVTSGKKKNDERDESNGSWYLCADSRIPLRRNDMRSTSSDCFIKVVFFQGRSKEKDEKLKSLLEKFRGEANFFPLGEGNKWGLCLSVCPSVRQCHLRKVSYNCQNGVKSTTFERFRKTLNTFYFEFSRLLL